MPNTSVKIGDYSEAHLLKTAKTLTGEKTKDAKIFDAHAEARIPLFEKSELTIGRVLGRGGFCVVSQIDAVTLKDGGAASTKTAQRDEEDIAHLVQDRDFMAKYCLRKGKDPRYAIKQLSDDTVLKDPHTYVNGIMDLAIEARFLAVIRHPNIIKMRAMAVGTPYSRDFFVVLDRLYDILGTRLITWKKRKPGGLRKLMDPKGKKKSAFWLERITVAHDLACALKHLHGLNVVYRDLKPDNIGFDVRGDVKIFDFGLAKEYDPAKADKNGLYNLTGDTGSTRYMAVEVALSKPYNETCDVYGFGVLFYQILALETPFEGLTVKSFPKMVYQKGMRPVVDPKWPLNISSLMQRCWSAKIGNRPSMEEVADVLFDEISSNTDEEIFDIMDVSRKSEMSLRGGTGSRPVPVVAREELDVRHITTELEDVHC